MKRKNLLVCSLTLAVATVSPLTVLAETTGEKINRIYHTSIAAIDREALESDLLELESSLIEIELVENVNEIGDESVKARTALLDEQLLAKEVIANEFQELKAAYEYSLTTTDLDTIISLRLALQNFIREHEISEGVSLDTRLFSNQYVTSHDVSSADVRREILSVSEKLTDLNESVNYGLPPKEYPIQGTLTSGFGLRSDPFNGQTAFHNGIDIAAPRGTPVKAWFNGVVAVASTNASNGNYVVIEQGELSTLYAHLDTMSVQTGDVITQGTVIGTVGSTGRSTGNHLHFGMYINGVSVDPSKLLKEVS